MDFGALRDVFPEAPYTFQESFEMSTSWQVEMHCAEPVAAGNGVTVDCKCVHEIVFNNRDRQSFTRQVTFTLYRLGNSWLIQELTQH